MVDGWLDLSLVACNRVESDQTKDDRPVERPQGNPLYLGGLPHPTRTSLPRHNPNAATSSAFPSWGSHYIMGGFVQNVRIESIHASLVARRDV